MMQVDQPSSQKPTEYAQYSQFPKTHKVSIISELIALLYINKKKATSPFVEVNAVFTNKKLFGLKITIEINGLVIDGSIESFDFDDCGDSELKIKLVNRKNRILFNTKNQNHHCFAYCTETVSSKGYLYCAYALMKDSINDFNGSRNPTDLYSESVHRNNMIYMIRDFSFVGTIFVVDDTIKIAKIKTCEVETIKKPKNREHEKNSISFVFNDGKYFDTTIEDIYFFRPLIL